MAQRDMLERSRLFHVLEESYFKIMKSCFISWICPFNRKSALFYGPLRACATADTSLPPRKSSADILNHKIKSLEAHYDPVLTPGLPFIVRLDGCSFKNFTTGMKKPFDGRLTLALIKTMNDLMERTSAVLGFTQSDEISLVYRGDTEATGLPFNGRANKIVSVFASMAAAKFNYYLSGLNWEDRLDSVKEKVTGGQGFFDARAFSVPDDITAMEAIVWRHKLDCRRNAIHTVGVHHFPHKKIQGLSLGQVMDLLKEEKRLDVMSDIPKVFLYGVFAKKILVSIPYQNPYTGERGKVLRPRIENRIFDWKGSAEVKTNMTIAKHWEPHHPESIESLDDALPVHELSKLAKEKEILCEEIASDVCA